GEDTPVTVYLQRTNAVSTEEESLSAQNSLFLSNYPNPFNPSTTISWQMPEEGQVEVSIFNIKGQKVKTLCHQRLTSGQHQIVWDGKEYGSGVYFVRLQTGNQTLIRKILMMK
ncbi:MAG: T9SS type A sorting domain-containing protein, partial [Candidatus Cloacimonetes bacterium]|nr:T9SS type A sorting domain-containing protein [Candidatus Cloacimonadota bacterium]